MLNLLNLCSSIKDCRRTSGCAGAFLFFALVACGCGPRQAQPLNVAADRVASLDVNMPYLLPANTKLEALNKCVASFPAADLFEPGDVIGDVIGEVVVIDDDALMQIAPHNEKISLQLEQGQSMLIRKSRTITVDEADGTPCRFQTTPDGP